MKLFRPFFLSLLLLGRFCFGQVIIEGNGQKLVLLPGTYSITVPKTAAEPEQPKPEEPKLVNCGCDQANFSILSVTKKEGSMYVVKFDACNVNPLTWQVGTKSATFIPTSATFTVDLSGLPDGENTLKLSSTGCNGKAEKQFSITSGNTDPPVRTSSAIQFIENGTGNSVDFNAANGISNNFPEQFKNFAESGVDVIRLVFSVGAYHPSQNIYKNEKLSDAIRWVRALPNSPKVDLLLVPTFPMSDIRFLDADLHQDAAGNKADCTFGLATFPSYYSTNAAQILDEAYDSLLPYLTKNHLSDINDLSFAGGPSEEHHMPYTANFAGGPGCGFYGGIGDYSEAARNAWRSFLADKYGGLLATVPFPINGLSFRAYNAPLPFIAPTASNNYNLNFNIPAHREVTRFWNQGVFSIWERFYRKVKQHTPFNCEYFIADMFNDQSVRWTFNAGTMAKAMQLCDIWYHTHNHSPYDWSHNLVGTDVLHGGSFGEGKISAIEYDPFDAGPGASGGALNVDHLKRSIQKFIQHGGRKIHWAMNWNSSQISQLGEVMKYVRDNAAAWMSAYAVRRADAPVVTLSTSDLFNSSAFLDNIWQSTGNSLGDPYNAKMVNVRVEDTFWIFPKP